jgi:hypothetical protein
LTTANLIEDKYTAHKDDDTSPGTNDGGIRYYEEMKAEDKICVEVMAHTGCTECGATTEGHLEVDVVRKVPKIGRPRASPRPTSRRGNNPRFATERLETEVLNILSRRLVLLNHERRDEKKSGKHLI